MALADFSSRQFKTRMKKMAAQVDFCLFRNAFLSCLQYGARENWHICANKGLAYLLKKSAHRTQGKLAFFMNIT